MERFILILALLLPLLAPSFSSELVNFLYFDDDDTNTVPTLVATATDILKKGEARIGKTYRIHLKENFPKDKADKDKVSETFKEYMTTNDSRPMFLLDFTKKPKFMAYVYRETAEYGIPTVLHNNNNASASVKHMFTKLGITYFTIDPPYYYFQMKLLSPEGIMEDIVSRIVGGGGIFEPLVQSDTTMKKISFRAQCIDRTLLHWTPLDDKTASFTALRRAHSTNVTFLIGCNTAIEKMLKDIKQNNPEMISTHHKLWLMFTSLNTTINIPKGLEAYMYVTPSLKLADDKLKLAKTNSFTDMFYLDSIMAGVKAAGRVKKNNKEMRQAFYQYYREELSSNTNFLGKYARHGNTHSLKPDIQQFTVNAVKTTSNTTVSDVCGFLPSPYSFIPPEFHTTRLAVFGRVREVIRAAVVLGFPFVMRNQTCDAKKKCINPYIGYCIDLITKIKMELQNFDIRVTKVGTHKSVIEMLESGKVDLGIGAFSTDPSRKRAVLFTEPFYQDEYSLQQHAFAFSLKQGFRLPLWSHMIMKLENQRYLAQLMETWYHGYTLNKDDKRVPDLA